MAILAIGDVQGCYGELKALLREANYKTKQDVLWFTGDLVNRGPKSLDVLRFVADLNERAVTVLGNHDLHMLAVAESRDTYRKSDTFRDVLDARDGEQLLIWLRQKPLLHRDNETKLVLFHAGLAPQWDVVQAESLAQEVEVVLRGKDYRKFFDNMYGNEPDNWDANLRGWDRLRFITNTFTRLRFCMADGKQLLKEKGGLATQPAGYMPWFRVPNRRSTNQTLLFGHWAALGAGQHDGVFSLDSGCAWGGRLTALRIDGSAKRFFSVPSLGYANVNDP